MGGRTLSGAVTLGSAAMAAWLPAQVGAAASDAVRIMAPAKREVLGCYPVELELDVDFRQLLANNPQPQFKLRLNGKNIEANLDQTDTGYRALLSPEDGLRVGIKRAFGANTLISKVKCPRRASHRSGIPLPSTQATPTRSQHTVTVSASVWDFLEKCLLAASTGVPARLGPSQSGL